MKTMLSRISFGLCVILLGGLYSFTNLETQVKGWFLTGSNPDSYEIGISKDESRGGKVAFIKSTKSNIKGFGTIMQTFSAENYLGKKLKLSGYIKTDDVKGWVGMWMRVDGKGKRSLSFDNMQNRKIKGTNAWKKYEIVLDVPTESSTINYGVLLNSTGTAYLDDLSFEEVSSSTASTGREYKKEPTNSSFED